MTDQLSQMADDEAVKRLSEATRKHRELHDKKIRSQSDLERAEGDLADARAEAERELGMSDIDALRAALTSGRTENGKRVREFEAALEGIRVKLANLKAN